MDLLDNPFHILAVSPRDNRRRIMEMADARSLLPDSSDCMEARSDLTNPRKRLSAEVAWLPGIAPKRAGELLLLLESSPTKLLVVDKLSSLARANLLVAGLARLPEYRAENVAEWILEIAWAFENVDLEELGMTINEERAVSGFPEVKDLSAIEAEIQERRRYYLKVIKSALNTLSAEELVKAVTAAVESATDNGETHGPILIADLVDSYEVEAQAFLEKEENTITLLVEGLHSAADDGQPDSVLEPMVHQLILVMKNWDTVAQPIQVSTKSRGLDHDASRRIARLVRELAIHMFNKHGKLDFSKQLTDMLQGVFAEVGVVAELTGEDATALRKITERRIDSAITSLCETARKNAEVRPSFADKEARRVIDTLPELIAKMPNSSPEERLLYMMFGPGDEIVRTLIHCAALYGNATNQWKSCIALLKAASKFSCSGELKKSLKENLEIANHNNRLCGPLTPITTAPRLHTINGVGTTMCGRTDYDPVSKSYLSTYCFVVFHFPLFPICRYRVIKESGGYRFLGQSPLRTFDKVHIGISIVMIVLAYILIR